MGLKQIIKQQKILAASGESGIAELTLPGEPMIYCIKYSLGSRTRSVQFFRNMQWKSLLKCYFKSYTKTSVPVVVVVRFFVSPPESVVISAANLRKESVPAVFAYEVCDYLLSFLEMIHHVLVNSYRQIVRIDVEKFYSHDPRTVLKFMRWDQHVKLQSQNPVRTKAKAISSAGESDVLQPKPEGHD